MCGVKCKVCMCGMVCCRLFFFFLSGFPPSCPPRGPLSSFPHILFLTSFCMPVYDFSVQVSHFTLLPIPFLVVFFGARTPSLVHIINKQVWLRWQSKSAMIGIGPGGVECGGCVCMRFSLNFGIITITCSPSSSSLSLSAKNWHCWP